MTDHSEDPRPGSRLAKIEAMQDLREEHLLSRKESYLAAESFRTIQETLRRVDPPGPNPDLEYDQFITQCEQIHATLSYFLNSNANALSTLENGGCFTQHKVSHLYESNNLKQHSDYKPNPMQGRYLWYFDYVHFYDTLLSTVSPFHWFEPDGTLSTENIFNVIKETPLLREIGSEQTISFNDFIQSPAQRSVHSYEALSSKYRQFHNYDGWKDIAGNNKEIHNRWMNRCEQVLENHFQTAWQRALKNFHEMEIKNLYDYKSIYERCAEKNILEQDLVEKKIGIAFILSHRHSNPTFYSASTEFPYENIYKYAIRISSVAMELSDMDEEQRKDALLRMDMGEYLSSILMEHKSFFKDFLESRPYWT